MIRIRLFAPILFISAAVVGTGQDSGMGLGRIYIEPLNGSFEKLLKFEIVRQHIPVLIVDSAKSADCVLGWTAMPGAEGRTDFLLVDRQSRSVAWEFRTREANLNSPKRNVPQKTSAQIVHSLSKAGAYCGGAAFSAPAEGADQRVKAFKPPTFNW